MVISENLKFVKFEAQLPVFMNFTCSWIDAAINRGDLHTIKCRYFLVKVLKQHGMKVEEATRVSTMGESLDSFNDILIAYISHDIRPEDTITLKYSSAEIIKNVD